MRSDLSETPRHVSLFFLALGVALVFQTVIFRQSQNDIERLVARGAEIDRTATDLLFTIGFVGMIHDFKNCVLRGAEPRYCDLADKKASDATELVSRLQTEMSAFFEQEVVLSETAAVIALYQSKIDLVRELHDEQLPVAEIDARVRIDDGPARAELIDIVERIFVHTEERAATIWLRFFQLVLAAWGVFACLVWGLSRLVRRERLMRDQREYELEAVLKTISLGVVGLTADGRVATFNPAARELLRLTTPDLPCDWPEDLQFLDRDALQPVPPEALPIRRIISGETLTDAGYMVAFGTVDGGSAEGGAEEDDARYVSLSSAKVADTKTDLEFVLVINDVTAQEKIRHQVDRASRLEALGQMTGGFAHDFNNILSTMKAALQLAKPRTVDPKARNWIDAALAAVQRGTALASRLLSFSRREITSAERIAVRSVLTDVGEMLEPVVGKDIMLRVELPDEALAVYCEPAELETAIVNLVLNAKDAIQEAGVAGEIVLRAGRSRRWIAGRDDAPDDESDDENIEITVKDNGGGMSPEVLERAVDPFFTTKTNEQGTGLGLAMVYGFLKRSGGDLAITSEPDAGAEVSMILPRAEAGAVPAASAVRPMRVLVVDPDQEAVGRLTEMLGALGCVVIATADAALARSDIPDAEPYDMIMVSPSVPERAAISVQLADLRAAAPDARVVVLTDREPKGLVPPGETVLRKPVAASDLALLFAFGWGAAANRRRSSSFAKLRSGGRQAAGQVKANSEPLR